MTNNAASPFSLGLAAGATTSPQLELATSTAGGMQPVPGGPPWAPPGDPGSAGIGISGSAPIPGSGLNVLALGPYKLAAPAHFGPQLPAPTLGRSAAFLDPFERPG
jgi:hypothetical protein